MTRTSGLLLAVAFSALGSTAATCPKRCGEWVYEPACPGPPTNLWFYYAPGTALQNVVMYPVSVRSTDVDGNPVSVTGDVTIAITAGTGTPSAALHGTLIRPMVNGLATFDDLAIDSIGYGYTLTATLPGLKPAVSIPFAVVPP